MGRPQTIFIDGTVTDYPVRSVPRAYRYLSFDAKIFYASKYGENVWSRSLVYNDGSTAAVGPDNKPLSFPKALKLDAAGNVVSYMNVPVEDLETVGFSRDGTWEEQRAKLNQVRRMIYRVKEQVIADRIEQERIKSEQDRYKAEVQRARVRKMEQGLQKLRGEKAKAEKEAKDEADRKDKEEADRKAKDEADRKAKEEADRKAKEEADRKAEEEADRKAKEEADRKAKEEADRKAKEEADRKAEEEAERKAKEENKGKWLHQAPCDAGTPARKGFICSG